MGLLDTLFGRGKAVMPPLPPKGPCAHTALVPRWGNVADMGDGDKVTTYTCDGCQQSFTAEAGRALRQEARRAQTAAGA